MGTDHGDLGSEPAAVRSAAQALVSGFQQISNNRITNVLATTKHYLGDDVNAAGYRGALAADTGSLMLSYSAINETPMSVNGAYTKRLRDQNEFKKPFAGFIVSDYGAIDRVAHQQLPTKQWGIPYREALARAIYQGGIETVMISSTAKDYHNLAEFLALLKNEISSGAIPEAKIDTAVTHILAVKAAMGLINFAAVGKTPTPVEPTAQKANKAAIALATRAAQESLVLLKNDKQLLPLHAPQLKYVLLTGESLIPVKHDDGSRSDQLFQNYDNIGAQNGGWTMAWQGINGNALWQGENKRLSGASSLLDGIKKVAPKLTLLYPHYQDAKNKQAVQRTRERFLAALSQDYPDMNAGNTVIINVLAEVPYAEFMGDIGNPYCTDSTTLTQGCQYNNHLNAYLPDRQQHSLRMDFEPFAKQAIAVLKKKHGQIPVVTVLFSGRPRLINQPGGSLAQSQAFLAAWLPGTSGGDAVATSLFGQYQLRPQSMPKANSLSLYWPASEKSLSGYPVYTKGKRFVAIQQPLFKPGDGLVTR